MLRVLIRLCGGYGLGDIVQSSIMLKHLRRFRPDWQITIRADKGASTGLHGLCHRVISYDEPEEGLFDQTIDLNLNEQYGGYTDRPDTKVAHLLKTVFAIDEYAPDLGRYECRFGEKEMHEARRWLVRNQVPCNSRYDGQFKAVCLHYQGGSHGPAKNLAEWQAAEIIGMVTRAGRVVILMDWNKWSPFPDGKTVLCRGADEGGSAAVLAALISQCEAFVGIDSGPGKIASATETPTLICWTRHHPLKFHDPAPNTMHLIPAGAQSDFFAKNYLHIPYRGEHGLVAELFKWLGKILHCPTDDPGVKIVIPPGWVAASWVAAKLRNIVAGRPIDIIIGGKRDDPSARDTIPFFHRLPFVRSVNVKDIPIFMAPERPQNTRGHTLYISEGFRDGYHYLIPNIVQQAGGRLKDWMPDVAIDWETVEGMPEQARSEVWVEEATE